MMQRTPRASAARGPEADPAAVAERAARGAGSDLPFHDQIQAAFGPYDLSQARAHVGPEAEEATQALDAAAFAYGSDVAFGVPPDLFTAAHEAAHVVAQERGAAPTAEMGADDDAFEQMADEVAERVVAGKSAVDILDREIGDGGAAEPTVQRLKGAFGKTRFRDPSNPNGGGGTGGGGGG